MKIGLNKMQIWQRGRWLHLVNSYALIEGSLVRLMSVKELDKRLALQETMTDIISYASFNKGGRCIIRRA
jgi:hypothetical protein